MAGSVVAHEPPCFVLPVEGCEGTANGQSLARFRGPHLGLRVESVHGWEGAPQEWLRDSAHGESSEMFDDRPAFYVNLEEPNPVKQMAIRSEVVLR